MMNKTMLSSTFFFSSKTPKTSRTRVKIEKIPPIISKFVFPDWGLKFLIFLEKANMMMITASSNANPNLHDRKVVTNPPNIGPIAAAIPPIALANARAKVLLFLS